MLDPFKRRFQTRWCIIFMDSLGKTVNFANLFQKTTSHIPELLYTLLRHFHWLPRSGMVFLRRSAHWSTTAPPRPCFLTTEGETSPFRLCGGEHCRAPPAHILPTQWNTSGFRVDLEKIVELCFNSKFIRKFHVCSHLCCMPTVHWHSVSNIPVKQLLCGILVICRGDMSQQPPISNSAKTTLLF